jgi:hypothetical protein
MKILACERVAVDRQSILLCKSRIVDTNMNIWAKRVVDVLQVTAYAIITSLGD